MSGSNLKQETSTVVKTHEEILAMIEKIKQFEQRFPEFEIEEPKVEEELIEVKHEPEEFNLIEEPTEIQKEPTSPTVFRLRFTEEGKLENIDLKKPKPKKESRSSLKKLEPKKKGKKEESEITEREPKKSRLKGRLSKISKLKRVIPSRSKEEEATEEAEE